MTTRHSHRCTAAPLLILLLSLPLEARAQGPDAFLTNVSGAVQVVHGGRISSGRTGTPLYNGDRVRVASGRATVFAATQAARTVTAGHQVTVGGGGATSSPVLWRSVMNGLANGFSSHYGRTPATMRPGSLQALAPLNSKVLSGSLKFVWAYGEMEAANRATYEVFIHDDAGFAWSGRTTATMLSPPSELKLLPAHRYYWIATPLNAQGEPNAVWATREAWFQIAGPAEVTALAADRAELKSALDADPEALAVANAAMLNERGFGDAAVAELEPVMQHSGSAPDEAVAALFRLILVGTKRWELLAQWFPAASGVGDHGVAMPGQIIALPKPGGPTDQVPPGALKVYQDAEGAFRLSLPVAWGATRQQIVAGTWFTDCRAEINSSPAVSVTQAATASLKGGSLGVQIFDLLKKNGEFGAEPAVDITFAGAPARKTVWTWKKGPIALSGYSLELVQGQNTYLLSVSQSAPPAAHEAAFHLAEQVLATFAASGEAPPAAPRPTFNDLMAEMKNSMALMDLAIKAQDVGRRDPAKAPATAAEAQTVFEEQDALRQKAAPGTLERVDASREAARAASSLAWLLWDAKQHPEAAAWFDRRDKLVQENFENTFAYYEAAVKATDARLAELRRLTAEVPLARAVASDIDGWMNLQVARVTLLRNAAYASGDSARQLRYAMEELALQRMALNDGFLSNEPAARQDRQRVSIARAIEAVADAQEAMADYGQAEKTYLLALDWRTSVPEGYADRSLDTPMRDLGYLYMITGETARSTDWYGRSLAELDRTAPLRQAAINAETNQKLKIIESAGEAQTYALIWNNLGFLREGSGDYHASEDAYNKALAAVEPLEQTGYAGTIRASMRATSLRNLAILRADFGEIDEGLKMGDEAAALDLAVGDDQGEANWLLNRAGLLTVRNNPGDYAAARADTERALRLFQSLRNLTWVANAEVFLGMLEVKDGHLAQANDYTVEALKVARALGFSEGIANAARALARVQLEQLRGPQAPTRRAEAWPSFDALLTEAARADERLGWPESTMKTLYLRGVGRETRGDLGGALEDYKSAIALLEAQRATARSQQSFAELEGSYRYYQNIVLLLLKMNRAGEAFDYLTRARSKKMQDTLKLSTVHAHDPALQTLLDLGDSLRKKLGTLETQLKTEQARPSGDSDPDRIANLEGLMASTQADFFQVSKKIKAANPAFEKVLTIKPAELKKAQHDIPQDAVLVEYAPLGEQLYIFVVTRDNLKIYAPKVKPADLWAAVSQFRLLMDAAQTDVRNGKALPPIEADAALKTNITSLYAMLIKPIEAEIKSKSTVAFVPTSRLYYLPLHALARDTPQGLRYLIEDKRVAYLAAADVLSVVQPRTEGRFGAGMLALGDPTGANLPAALQEVQEISKIYPASQALTGVSATKKYLLDGRNLDRRVLHLATHGVLDGAHPEESYIQLAGAGDEGRLKLGEVYGLQLDHIDLVTLSACQTALGQRDPDGSEITSLAEAFSSAGAPSVVASLWSVEDESTRQLMDSFYGGLAAGKGKSESLQAAQMALLKDQRTRHPFFWAPFEVLGDWR